MPGSGISVAGVISGLERVFMVLKEQEDTFDAVAISSVISVPREFHQAYFDAAGKMVNPWGGIEAMLTHAISSRFDVPSAHSPMFEAEDISNQDPGVVDPRMAAEAISLTFFESVLKGLHKSPHIVTESSRMSEPGVISAADAYAAGTWNAERRVIARIEHGPKGANPRCIVTNPEGDAQDLYEKLYCARGDMENRIKEQQLDLFADRTSCHKWWPNQFRLLLSSLAYALVETIRRLGLAGTEMARAQAGTIRLKLLKIGAVIVRNTRRVRFQLSSACPYKALFTLVAARLDPG